MQQKLVILVDEIRYSKHGNILIKTAFESLTERSKYRHIVWGNSWVRNHGPDTHFHSLMLSDNLEYATLAEVEIQPSTVYVYIIPISCRIEAGAADFIYSMPVELQKKIADNNISILFDYSCEVFEFHNMGFSYLASFRDLITTLNNSYSKKILISAANMLVGHDLPNSYAVATITLPFRGIHDRSDYSGATQIDLATYQTSDKKYLFMSLNSRPRPLRVLLYFKLLSADLLKFARHSFTYGGNSELTPASNWLQVDDCNIKYLISTSNLDFSDQKHQYLYDVVDENPPLTRIPGDIGASSNNINGLYNPEWAYDTCFDLISETGGFGFETNSPVLSEKIFKSIFYKRIFMVNGEAKNLELIRNLGFKTFPDIFDESYDDCLNVLDRHEIIVKNIERYKDDFGLFMNKAAQCHDILEHNYNWLMQVGNLEGKMIEILLDAAAKEI